jgi:hypothetical protein
LFRGRPVYFNSIFVDGFALFPQMDVWSRNAVDRIDNGSAKANRDSQRVQLVGRFRNLPSSAGRSVFSEVSPESGRLIE